MNDFEPVVQIELEDDECPFCGARLRARQVFADCDDAEIYCPDCSYVASVE